MINGNDRRNSTQDLGVGALLVSSDCLHETVTKLDQDTGVTLAKGGGGFIQIFTHNLLHNFIRIPTDDLPLSHTLLTWQIIIGGR